MVIFVKIDCLQWAYFLRYNNIMYLKRSHFLMKIHDYENENKVQSENLEEFNFTVFTHFTYSYVHMKPLLDLFMKENGHFSKWCNAV